MKKHLTLLTLVLFTNQLFAQFTPGRYIIKLVHNQNAVEVSAAGFTQINTTCADYNINCDNQIFDIKPMRTKPGFYYIQNVKTRKCFTYLKPTSQIGVEFVQLKPQLPITNMRPQLFTITAQPNGSFVIQPDVLEPGDASNAYYLITNDYNYTNSGVVLKYNNAQSAAETAEFQKKAQWSFFPVPLRQTVRVIPQPQSGTVQAPTVIVAPPSPNKIDVEFKTGGDNLEPKNFQDNVEIRVLLKGRADVIKLNANNGQSWPNNSTRRVSIPLPADITLDGLNELHIYRKPTYGIRYVWELGEKDNWNLDKITAIAYIKTDGAVKRFPVCNNVSTGAGIPLFRFIYDGGNTVTDGTVYKTKIGYVPNYNVPGATTSTTPQNATIYATFGTGGDNLEGGNNNVNLFITFHSSPRKIAVLNINNRASFANFTEITITKLLAGTTNLDINDIKQIELHHTGGGGISADNWNLDKFKCTISKNGVSKVLVDAVEAPYHRFTGDTRIKRISVLQ
jgi:hypothetical protein